MKFCVIGSGSTGNMTYVETNNCRILIDTGISFQNATSRTNIDFSKITDIFITHHHRDHIIFLGKYLKINNCNLYLTKECFNNLPDILRNKLIDKNIFFIESDCKYNIEDITLYTLKMNHDAVNTLGFIIFNHHSSLGYFTDTGIFPSKYLSLLKDLDAIIIEANHNVTAQINSNRRQHLIARVLSSKGHLSNDACFNVLNATVNEKTKIIILAHISIECNSLLYLEEDIISKLINFNKELHIASAYDATKIFEV